jgi:ATP-binding cassette subfamily B multidrug efflux pump
MIELLKRFGRPFSRELVVGPLSKLVEVVFDLCTPLVVALMIDRGVGERDVSALIGYGALLVAMALAGFCSTLICQKMASRASQGLGTHVRDALFCHINTLSFVDIDRFGTPSLITRITNDVNQVQLALALAIRQMTRFPLLAIGSMIAALLIDARLGVIFLVSTPVIGGIFWLVMTRCIPYFKQMQYKLDRVALITREGLSGARVIRAFVREDHERGRFAQAASDQADIAIAVGRLSSLLNPVTFLIMNLAVCAILWVGGMQVDTGELTQGQVMAFVNYMTQTLLAIVYVANLVVVFTKASASAGRIVEVLDCMPSVVDAAAPEDVSDVPAAFRTFAIRLRNVSFAYPGSSLDSVHAVSLQVPIGGTLGVIGGTGSGKSTLVNLLPRLYDARCGSVEVLGRDVRAWRLLDLRRSIGCVPQKAELVRGTVRSNLAWRKEAPTDEELWRALEVAQAAEFVRMLPEGLDAPVEAGGKNFSGGQRQRLTIARALVGEPSVLILDDSASALDFKTDAALRAALRRAASNTACTVVVSQRVSSVRDADVICVMRRGVAVGVGTHEDLCATCDVYREIVESQMGREKVASHA